MPIKIEPYDGSTKRCRAKQPVKASELVFGGSPNIGFLLSPGERSHVDQLNLHFIETVLAAGIKTKILSSDMQVLQTAPQPPLKQHQIPVFDPTFSKDGKWVAYVSYPDHTLWRSRTDGSDRLQLTYPPIAAMGPRISADGTKVCFHTDDGVAYAVEVDGGTPQKLSENAWFPDWSPDGNLVTFTSVVSGKPAGEKGHFQTRVEDLRTGSVSAVPGAEGTLGAWFVTQDTIVAATEDQQKLLLFNLKTPKRSKLASNTFVAWEVSPDGKYLYCTTGGNEPKVLRIRFADHAVETITDLKNLRVVDDPYTSSQVSVAPDGSALFTRDIGTQEIYALSVKWP